MSSRVNGAIGDYGGEVQARIDAGYKGTRKVRKDAVRLVEVDSDGSELPGDWEYDRKGGYVYCSFS